MQISGVTSSSILNYLKVSKQQDVQPLQQFTQNQPHIQLDPDHDGDIDSHLGRDIDVRA